MATNDATVTTYAPQRPIIEPYKPFPVEVFPPTVRRYIDEAAATIGCDSSYIALPLIAAVGSAIGNARRVKLKNGWSEPCVIWTAIVGESGQHKSPAIEQATGALQRRQELELQRHDEEMQDFEAQQLEYEKAVAAWRKSRQSEMPTKPQPPAPRRLLCRDTTVEALAEMLANTPRGLLLCRDELAAWLGSFNAYKNQGRSDAAQWLEMFGAKSLIVDRKTGNKRTIHVPRAAVSITGGIQPGPLAAMLGREHFEDGLAARFLMAMPPRRQRRWGDDELDPAWPVWLDGIFDRLFSLPVGDATIGSNEPVDLPLAGEAKRLFVDFVNRNGERQAQQIGDLAAAYSKLECYAARLALVIHCMRWAEDDPMLANPDVIDGVSISAGIALVEWFTDETRRIYTAMNEPEEHRAVRKLYEYVDAHSGMAKLRDIQRAMGYARADDVRAHVRMLEDAGMGMIEQITHASGGRPSECFRLTCGDDTDKTPAGGSVGGVMSVSADDGNHDAH